MESLYRELPKVDELLEDEKVEALISVYSRDLVVRAIRKVLDDLRVDIGAGIQREDLLAKVGEIGFSVEAALEEKQRSHLRKVVNGTGVVLHTNLGRAPLTEEILDHIRDVTCGYSNLEYDLEEGERGERYSHLNQVIQDVTGAESSMVVNNNAAAVMLILSTLAKGKEVITSRGELIEIGGSFRIPDVCVESGASLVEVGTTNKTHLRDYENAITENTSAILKVHTSNYKVMGFTDGVTAEELLDLKREKDIYIIEDLGSGVLIDLSKYGLSYEPTVQDSVASGVDVVSFSGDKLLGGAQAGIILGTKEVINKLKANQLTRALRVDKFTIAALEKVFRYYYDEKIAREKIPVVRMLTEEKTSVKARAEKLLNLVNKSTNYMAELVQMESEVGGGSLPMEKIKSYGISLECEDLSAAQIEKVLRFNEVPIIGRLFDGKYHLDARTLVEDEFEIIIKAIGSDNR